MPEQKKEPPIDWNRLSQFRRELHRHPELAHQEKKTAERVVGLLQGFEPHEVITNLGGNGVAALFCGREEGPTVLVRCELDAVPLEEALSQSHTSSRKGVSHKCGHDGHTAILVGLAAWLHWCPPSLGRVVLLFQPAEEVGEGARCVLDDSRFAPLRPDIALALHNLPGFELGEVILRPGPFSSASRGLIARFRGQSAHAGQPERARSPALALAEAILGLSALPSLASGYHEPALITITGATLGGFAFGSTPGEAELYATVRAERDEVLDMLWTRSQCQIEKLAASHDLEVSVQSTEGFPAMVNDPGLVSLVETAAQELGFSCRRQAAVFPWSEDFAHFSGECRACLVGLGAGVDHPDLHSPGYDFPDELISWGTRLLSRAVEKALRT